MEKKIYAIKINVDILGDIARDKGMGLPCRSKSAFCEHYLPFYGTRQEAEAAALGLSQGCERQAKKFYESGWKTVMIDEDVVIDSAF